MSQNNLGVSAHVPLPYFVRLDFCHAAESLTDDAFRTKILLQKHQKADSGPCLLQGGGLTGRDFWGQKGLSTASNEACTAPVRGIRAMRARCGSGANSCPIRPPGVRKPGSVVPAARDLPLQRDERGASNRALHSHAFPGVKLPTARTSTGESTRPLIRAQPAVKLRSAGW